MEASPHRHASSSPVTLHMRIPGGTHVRRYQQVEQMLAGAEYNGWDVLMPMEREFRCPVCRRLATGALSCL